MGLKEALILLLTVTVQAEGRVSCGGHYASSCRECPQGHGARWCNGDCHWRNEDCQMVGENKKGDTCSYPSDHTMTIYPGPSPRCQKNFISTGVDKEVQEMIVKTHNELRNRVAMGEESQGPQPSAADMRKMVWDDELATIAQRWTDQCKFGHDRKRDLCDGTYAGQNGYGGGDVKLSSSYAKNAVEAWFSEVKDFQSNKIDPFDPRGLDFPGHYTQVVWAKSDRVGCGFTRYKEGKGAKSIFFCNYAPGGNYRGSSMYKVGAPCSQCPTGTSCDSTYPGLCAA